MDQFLERGALGRLLLVIIMVSLLILSIFYLNSRWAKIRDIRREADAYSVIKALNFYNLQFGFYPENLDDDGDGWDKSNDAEARTFLEPLTGIGLLSGLVFDPKNDEDYYYRYQKFAVGDFGCHRPYAVFQVASFETKKKSGTGSCPDINWAEIAPNGFTWFGED